MGHLADNGWYCTRKRCPWLSILMKGRHDCLEKHSGWLSQPLQFKYPPRSFWLPVSLKPISTTLFLGLKHSSFVTAAVAKSLQSCLTLCDPIDSSPPGSPIPGILQARTLEWVATTFSNAWKWKVKVKSLTRVQLLETPWTAAHQAPPSMGFSRQESWSQGPRSSPRERLLELSN